MPPLNYLPDNPDGACPTHVRILQEKTTYAAIFRGNSGDSESYLQVAQLDGWDFTAESLTASELDKMKGSEEETHPIYSVDSRSTSAVSGRHYAPSDKKKATVLIRCPTTDTRDSHQEREHSLMTRRLHLLGTIHAITYWDPHVLLR